MRLSNQQTYPQVIKLGLVGRGISYSKSPLIHTTWMKQSNIVGEYNLIDRDVFDRSKVHQLMSMGYWGVNITIPHKLSGAELANFKEDVVQDIGGANCLRFDGNVISATNTDALALYEYLKPYRGFNRAIIIGTGATARASSWVLKKLDIHHIVFLSRSKRDSQTFPLSELSKHVLHADILINASPWGMNDETQGIEITRESFFGVKCVVDWVYTPNLTYLLNEAKRLGINTVDGMSLLTKQADLSWSFWGLKNFQIK